MLSRFFLSRTINHFPSKSTKQKPMQCSSRNWTTISLHLASVKFVFKVQNPMELGIWSHSYCSKQTAFLHCFLTRSQPAVQHLVRSGIKVKRCHYSVLTPQHPSKRNNTELWSAEYGSCFFWFFFSKYQEKPSLR